MEAVHSILMQQIDEAQKKGDFVMAKSLLSSVREMMKPSPTSGNPTMEKQEDPYIIQRLALITYKSKFPNEEAALREAHDLLAPLNPETSNDTETLGLWGSVHKRLWDLTKDWGLLDEAIRGYERGFYLRNDYYNGINLAYLLNCRAAEAADPAEAVADFIQARRVRKEVLAICEQWLMANPIPDAQSASPAAVKQEQSNRYWVLATIGEAYLGLGDEKQSQEWLDKAFAVAPEEWMEKSTREQLAKLKLLLDKSPLKYIKPDATG
jgi:tetratricopeptide (TPR) repeat protein